jgi:hypothetical protein
MLSDAEWARIATRIMHRTGLAPSGDDLAVRWVAVRHASDHIHLVATLARQDRVRPKLWNDFFRVRDACQEAERWYSLRPTAPADRTASRRPTRAETEQTARRGWSEPPRARLRREVCTAAAGARTEQEFFTRLAQAGVLIRRRYSTTRPGEVTGYAVALADHTAPDGTPIWYSGGKLAADLTLPKLRSRWPDPETHNPLAGATAMPEHAIRGVLRATVTGAAAQAAGEQDFFSRLRACGLLVRYRYSELNPAQVTATPSPSPVTPPPTERSAGTAADACTPRSHCPVSGAPGPSVAPEPRPTTEHQGSPHRNAPRSTATPPARPVMRRRTSTSAPPVIRVTEQTRPGQPRTRCTPQREPSEVHCSTV